MSASHYLLGFLFVWLLATASSEEEQPKVIAGKADVLRDVPKKFATLVNFDPEKRMVRLHIEGEDGATLWPVVPDAEIKVHGWWGRPSQLHRGDRVWVWFAIDRDKEPVGVWMLADELSEQDIHGETHEIQSVDGDHVTVDVRWLS